MLDLENPDKEKLTLLNLNNYLNKKFERKVLREETLIEVKEDLKYLCKKYYYEGRIDKEFSEELLQFLKSIISVNT
jgi:hypothetical protein